MDGQRAEKKCRQVSLQKRSTCLNSVLFLLVEIAKVLISLFSQKMCSNSSVFGNDQEFPVSEDCNI